MARGYGQFCPVARAAELLAERWMPIVLRELLDGSRRFHELRRGIPRISQTMLAQRLRELVDAGLVARKGTDYALTPAGEATRPIVEAFAVWGQRWAREELRDDQLDPRFLMWAVHRAIDAREVPGERAVLLFEFPEQRPSVRRWWIIVSHGEVDLCLKDPGHPIDLTVRTDVRTLTMVYLGRSKAGSELRAGRIVLSGSKALVRSFPAWCARSAFA